jgi:hypothetical protein
VTPAQQRLLVSAWHAWCRPTARERRVWLNGKTRKSAEVLERRGLGFIAGGWPGAFVINAEIRTAVLALKEAEAI